MRKRSKGVSRRELKPMFHVFCEDTKSARYYIDLFRELFCGNTRLIQIEDRSHTDPKGLVGEAIQLKKRVSRSCPHDEYWVVYDRESPQKYSDSIHSEALATARGNGVHVVLSNVCYEVWLLLHKTEHSLHCNTCDELLARPLFRKCFPKYDKGRKPDISRDEITSARGRALKMNRQTLSGADRGISENEPYCLNPYTQFPALLNAMESFSSMHGR